MHDAFFFFPYFVNVPTLSLFFTSRVVCVHPGRRMMKRKRKWGERVGWRSHFCFFLHSSFPAPPRTMADASTSTPSAAAAAAVAFVDEEYGRAVELYGEVRERE